MRRTSCGESTNRIALLLIPTAMLILPRAVSGLQAASVTDVAELERDLRRTHARATALLPPSSGVAATDSLMRVYYQRGEAPLEAAPEAIARWLEAAATFDTLWSAAHEYEGPVERASDLGLRDADGLPLVLLMRAMNNEVRMRQDELIAAIAAFRASPVAERYRSSLGAFTASSTTLRSDLAALSGWISPIYQEWQLWHGSYRRRAEEVDRLLLALETSTR